MGTVFPSNQLEKYFRDMYARLTDEHKIQDRIVRDVSPQRFREITENALEGLAKKDLNLSAIVGKSAEAKERRLVPEIVESFFVQAAPETGVIPKETGKSTGVFRVGKVPRNLLPIGDRQESRFGRLGREYGKIIFNKTLLPSDPSLEWVTPGHPLFEAVRSDCLDRFEDHLRRGARPSTALPPRLRASIRQAALDTEDSFRDAGHEPILEFWERFHRFSACLG